MVRAAAALIPLLQAAGTGALPHLWRGDECAPDRCVDCTPSGHAVLDEALPGGGWPHGQLIELLLDHPGIGELGLLLPALATTTRSGRSCAWILPCQAEASPSAAPQPSIAADPAAALPHALPYAPTLAEAGVDLTRNIFVKPLTAREGGWALEQSLRAAHLGMLLGWLPEGASAEADFRCLRRLHLLAQRNSAMAFILRGSRHAGAPSPAPLRLQLQHEGGLLQVRVLKRRGRPLLDPIALQIHPARWNHAAAATPVPATPAASQTAPLPHVVRALARSAAWPIPAAP